MFLYTVPLPASTSLAQRRGEGRRGGGGGGGLEQIAGSGCQSGFKPLVFVLFAREREREREREDQIKFFIFEGSR